MPISDNALARDGLNELRRRLPPGWTTREIRQPSNTFAVEIASPDKRVGLLGVDLRARLQPKGVKSLVDGITATRTMATPLVVSPYLSESTRVCLRENDVGYLDLTGNVRIVLAEPGLYIETHGASEDPDREERPARSLRGAKAGRVARALIQLKSPPGVRELASLTNIDAGYVSRVLSFLDAEALVSRGARGRIENVDWPGLLRRWATEAPLESRATIRTFLEPRGITALQTRLEKFDEPYVVSGSLAAVALAPIAPPRLATIWVRDVVAAASKLALRPADAGANVMLLETDDDSVFDGAVPRDGVWYASLIQVVLDSLTSPGRAPQEGEALIDWMKTNEERWRR